MADTEQQLEAVKQVVVLAGATARKSALEQLGADLRQRGLRVELAIGIERGMVALLQVSFRHRGNAVYLLCGGPELTAASLDKMALAIKSNGAPPHCIWSGQIDWAKPQGVVREAEHRLAALGCDLGPAPVAKAAPPTGTRPLLVAAPPPVRAPASRTMAAPASRTMPAATPLLPQPSPLLRTPSANVPTVSAATAEELRQADEPLELPRSPIARFVTSRAGMAVVAGVAILVVGAVGWQLTRGSDSAADTPDVKTAAMQTKDAAAVAAPEAEDEPESADGAENLAVVPTSVDEGSPTKAEVASPKAAAVPEPEVDLVEEDTGPSARSIADANSPAADAELVYAALKKQSIRAIDILLVSATATKPRGRRFVTARMRFDNAQAHCSELAVDGVGGWRLPDVGEAGWLTRANILREGTYWTSTKADAFGTERVVWNVRAKRMGSTHKRWKGGRVVCVRLHRPEDGGAGE